MIRKFWKKITETTIVLEMSILVAVVLASAIAAQLATVIFL